LEKHGGHSRPGAFTPVRMACFSPTQGSCESEVDFDLRPVDATSLQSAMTATQQPNDQLSWAAMSSPLSRYGNRFAALASTDEDEDGDAARKADEPYTTVRKKKQIRPRDEVSPQVVDQVTTNKNNTNQPNQSG